MFCSLREQFFSFKEDIKLTRWVKLLKTSVRVFLYSPDSYRDENHF